MAETSVTCCARFDPEPWQERWVELDGKRFVRDRVRSFLHIPLNFGAVMKRNMKKIQAADAEVPGMLVLSDENSLWGSDLYLEAAGDVSDARMSAIPGTYLAQVYEGPYRDIGKWIADLRERMAAKGKKLGRLFFYYTTCPACARKYGRNYVVLLGGDGD